MTPHGVSITLPNEGTPAEKRAAAEALREHMPGVAAALVNAERLEREADEEEGRT